MKTLGVGCLVVCLALVAACSSDGGPAIANSEGTGGKAGGTSTGGGQNGGATATGGMTGSGGYDATLAAQCSVDYQGDDCKGCLAASCCDAAKACFADAGCTAEYAKYQACIKEPNQTDAPACLSAFTRYAKTDAGAKHQGMGSCIISTCQLCGGVAPL